MKEKKKYLKSQKQMGLIFKMDQKEKNIGNILAHKKRIFTKDPRVQIYIEIKKMLMGELAK